VPTEGEAVKPQTPAQRVTNPVWLREQIGKLIQDCDASIKADADLAELSHADATKRAKHLTRVEIHCDRKRQLMRILEGRDP
jgi:hypothetical protein